jgi:predicted FMN-binding regulatory protein PaiB
MYPSPNYPTDPEAVEAFVAEHEAGTLVAATPAGYPQVTILPFVKLGDVIEVHCVQADPTFGAVVANPRVTFVVSDFLAFTPHHWVDPENAARATLHFRAVSFEGEAEVSTRPSDVAAALRRLLERYEPAATYKPIEVGDFYDSRLRRLASIRIHVVGVRAKFKLGPYGSMELKRDIVGRLQARGRPNDARAAAVIESSLPPLSES